MIQDKAKLANAMVKWIQDSEANARAQAGVPDAAAAVGSTLTKTSAADSAFAARVAALLRVVLATRLTPATHRGRNLTATEVAQDLIHALLVVTDIDDDAATAAPLDIAQDAERPTYPPGG